MKYILNIHRRKGIIILKKNRKHLADYLKYLLKITSHSLINQKFKNKIIFYVKQIVALFKITVKTTMYLQSLKKNKSVYLVVVQVTVNKIMIFIHFPYSTFFSSKVELL